MGTFFFSSVISSNLQTRLVHLHQKLRVCDVCGAYLSVLDSDRRLADHFGGKVGFPTRLIIPRHSIFDTDASGLS